MEWKGVFQQPKKRTQKTEGMEIMVAARLDPSAPWDPLTPLTGGPRITAG
jgi:hypothetical protein